MGYGAQVQESWEPRSPHKTPTSTPDGRDTGTHISPRRPVRRREDDEQSNAVGGPSPNRRVPGSNPLGDATLRLGNSPHGPSDDERPLKRRRASASLVLDEAEAEEEEDEEEEEVNPMILVTILLRRYTHTRLFRCL
jgi:hypothetical protein